MQLFHSVRYENHELAGPCGGRLVDTRTEDNGEPQYECSRCGQRGKPITDIDPDCDVDSNPIFLEGTDICVTDLLVPLSIFRPEFEQFMEEHGYERIPSPLSEMEK